MQLQQAGTCLIKLHLLSFRKIIQSRIIFAFMMLGNFKFFIIVDFGDNLVCYWNKTFRLRGIEFLINNEQGKQICYNLILLFGQKTISTIFFISTTNHNFLWIYSNNANAFSLLRNTSCLFHCSRHFILFLHFFSMFTLCTSTAYFLTC